MKIKKYKDFIIESNTNQLNVLYLISEKGEVLDKTGVIIFNKGIFDNEENEYVAAIGEDNKLYSNINDNNQLFININSDKYNPTEDLSWKEDTNLEY